MELSGGGLREGGLNLGSFGKDLPAVPTGDGAKIQQHRRVIIEISQ
jgi:hypothetical protein